MVLIVATCAVLLWLAGQALACTVWPFVACRRCGGGGKRPAPFGGKAFRLCSRCRGTGRRLRLGRWLFNTVARRRRAAG